MDILVTGRLAPVSASFFAPLAGQYKVVAASDDLDEAAAGKGCTPFAFSVMDEAFAKLFHSYSFEAVVYFAARPELSAPYFAEYGELEKVLGLCVEYDVKKVIFVSSTFVYEGLAAADEQTVPRPQSETAISLWACESLCGCYRRRYGLEALVLHAPCLYGRYENHSYLGGALFQAVAKGHVLLQGVQEQTLDLLSLEDLGELVMRILYDWQERLECINVPGARQLTLAELGVALTQVVKASRVAYSGQPARLYHPVASRLARQEFDWLPVADAAQELPGLAKQVNRQETEEKPRWTVRLWEFIKNNRIILRTLELALGYILMELLNRVSGTTVQFRGIDYRLLFVVLLGSVHGLKTGIAAAALASVSCLFGYLGNGMDWRVILYNVDNWMPFACYFIIGAITGYTRDKRLDDLAFARDDKEHLEQRYVFLNELYMSALENKGQYKKQIMSYRDSFGRIFEITKRLDTMMPDAIFKEALAALEDILDNRTVSIYAMNPYGTFGRLHVCSKQVIDQMPKSLDMSKLPRLKAELEKDSVWVNTDCLEQYPDYVFPIYRENQLILLVMVQEAAFEQMAMYFENLLKILCSLIEASLLRAQDYMEKFNDELYLPGSRVMKKEAFKELLRVREEMEEAVISE